jgi:hypothetical protein
MTTVRVFFNDAAGGSFATDSQQGTESALRRRLHREYDQRGYVPLCDGYDAERAVLVESMLSPMRGADHAEGIDLSGDDLAICERVFRALNADDRANGRYERSLSVGDVVEVDGRRYAVADVGFEAVAA